MKPTAILRWAQSQSTTMGTISIMPWAFAIVPGILTYLFGLIMYRVRLSPIAAFPGPFLARTTYWYEFYYNWIKCGHYYLKIEEMHQRYGEILLWSWAFFFGLYLNAYGSCACPIVRVTPTELHIREPRYYNQLFVTHAVRKSNAYTRFTQGAGFDGRWIHPPSRFPSKSTYYDY